MKTSTPLTAGWLNINKTQPKENDEVIININGKPQIAIYGGKARDTDEYLFYRGFKEHPKYSDEYISSWTCQVEMWFPLFALPTDSWIDLENQLPPSNSEVIIDYFGEPKIAIFIGKAVDGDELFFDYKFKYDPYYHSAHYEFVADCSFEIIRWQPLPKPPKKEQ